MPETEVGTPDLSPVAHFPHNHRTSDDAERALATLAALREFVKKSFVKDLDYGTIPGTKRTSLLQPGAQKIAIFFDAYPHYTVASTEFGEGHVEHIVTCALLGNRNHESMGEGVGSCTTMEKKYRYRQSERTCPECGKPAIIKGKAEYGGGWLCFKKKDGCGAKFNAKDPLITDQDTGTVENPDIYDERNTVLKMAKKRAMVDCALSVSSLTDEFTQDLEERHGWDEPADEPPARAQAPTGATAPEAERSPAPEHESAQNAAQDEIDPSRPKASLQKLLRVAFRDDVPKIRQFVSTVTAKLFGEAKSLNDLDMAQSRTFLEAVRTKKIILPDPITPTE